MRTVNLWILVIAFGLACTVIVLDFHAHSIPLATKIVLGTVALVALVTYVCTHRAQEHSDR